MRLKSESVVMKMQPCSTPTAAAGVHPGTDPDSDSDAGENQISELKIDYSLALEYFIWV